MFKIKIFSVGKIKEHWLQIAFDNYSKRLKSIAQINCQWVKDDTQLITFTQKEHNLIVLDPQGRLLTSEQFSKKLIQSLEIGDSRLSFVIGGARGIPAPIKKQGTLISLSPLTFTHQIARLILIEQIYRSFEISKCSHYHK